MAPEQAPIVLELIQVALLLHPGAHDDHPERAQRGNEVGDQVETDGFGDVCVAYASAVPGEESDHQIPDVGDR